MIGFTETMRLGRLPYEEQDAVLDSILSGTTRTRDELDQVVRERTTKPSKNGRKADVRRFSGPLPSGTTASFCGPLKCVSDLQEAARELAKQAGNALKDGVEDLKAFEVWLKAKDKRAS